VKSLFIADRRAEYEEMSATGNTKEWSEDPSPVVVISLALKLFSPSKGESRRREGFGPPQKFWRAS